MLLGSPGKSQLGWHRAAPGSAELAEVRVPWRWGSPRPDPERAMGEEGMEPWVRILHVLLSSWVSHFPSQGLCFLTDNTNG